MQAERAALETCVLELAGKRVALERWLADNESKTPQGGFHQTHTQYLAPDEYLERAGVTRCFRWSWARGRHCRLLSQVR